jgi:hypothetical protein
MHLHSFTCLDSELVLQWNSSKFKMAVGGHIHFDNDHDVSRVKGNPIVNKMTPDRRKSVKQF